MRRDKLSAAAQLEGYLRGTVLLPDERIVWRGRPAPIAAYWRQVGIGTLLGLFLMGFAVVMCFAANVRGYVMLTALAPFGFGLWCVKHPLLAAWRARRMFYAVTNRRALIVEARQGFRVSPIAPNEMAPLEVIDFGKGRTTILLRKTRRETDDGTFERVEFTDAFWGVEDGASAVEAIRALLASRAGGT